MARDIMGHELLVDDEVVFGQAQHMHLLRGKVIAVNAKTVKILYVDQENWRGEWKDVEKECNRAFQDVVIVSDV